MAPTGKKLTTAKKFTRTKSRRCDQRPKRTVFKSGNLHGPSKVKTISGNAEAAISERRLREALRGRLEGLNGLAARTHQADSSINDNSYFDFGDGYEADKSDYEAEFSSTAKQPLKNLNNRQKREENWIKVHSLLRDVLYTKEFECPINHNSLRREVILIDLDCIRTKELFYCECVGSLGAACIIAGYFPSSPIAPHVAFSLNLIGFFHNILMRGPLSKHAWAYGLQAFLSELTSTRIVDLKKPWEYAYINWIKIKTLCEKRFHEQAIQDTNGLWKQPGDLSEICPPCFNRTTDPSTPADPVILGCDGNFQLYRRKIGISHRAGNTTTFTTDAVEEVALRGELQDVQPIINVPKSSLEGALESLSIEQVAEKEAGGDCPHHFHAASTEEKTSTKFKNKDQTGVMNCVCRHDIVLALTNTFEGEKYFITRHLLQDIKDRSPAGTHFIMQYDIACRFGPSLQKKHPKEAEFLRFAMNAFHSYAHALACQLTFGPQRAQHLGLSDGEGVERAWSAICHLLHPTRICSSEVREILLDACVTYRSVGQRIRLGNFLDRKFDRALNTIKTAQTIIEEVKAHLVQQGYIEEYHTSEDVCEYLKTCSERQLEFFQIKKKAESDFQLKRKHETLWKYLMHEHNEMLMMEKIQRSNPSFDVIHTQIQVRKTPGKLPWAAWHSSGFRTRQEMVDDAIARTNAQFVLVGEKREDWPHNGDAQKFYARAFTWHLIKEEIAQLHRLSAARVMELRNIRHSHDTRGTKKASEHVQAIFRRLPALKSRANTIRKLMQALPRGDKLPEPPTLETFNPGTLEEQASQQLWELEAAYCKGIGVELNKEDHFISDAKILNGIEQYHRLNRGQEELLKIRAEWLRLAKWCASKLSNLQVIAQHRTHQFEYNFFQKLTIDAILTAEGVITCKEGFSDQSSKDDLSALVKEISQYVPKYRPKIHSSWGGDRSLLPQVPESINNGEDSTAESGNEEATEAFVEENGKILMKEAEEFRKEQSSVQNYQRGTIYDSSGLSASNDRREGEVSMQEDFGWVEHMIDLVNKS